MSTFRKLVYMVLDEVKGISDDFTLNENHIVFLLSKYRASILLEAYKINPIMAYSNYQTIEVRFNKQNVNDGNCLLYRSDDSYPMFMQMFCQKARLKNHKLDPKVTYIPFERLPFVISNRFLKNILYIAQGYDGKLYLKILNPSSELPYKAFYDFDIIGLFKNCEDIATIQADQNDIDDMLDVEFPLEDEYVPQLIQYVVKEVIGAAYRPKDPRNNASDDLAEIQTFIRQNMKDRYVKETE